MARKLNTKFIIAVAAAAALGVTALQFGPNLMRPSVAKLKADGEAALKGERFDEAALLLGKASNRDQNNIELANEYIDALDFTVRGDIEKYRTFRQMQARVLAIDPRNLTALRRVMAFQTGDVQNQPSDSASVRNLQNVAQRVLELAPGDRPARKAQITAVLEPYSRNLEISGDDLDRARKAAETLYAEDPADSEPLSMLVRFHLIAATRSRQAGEDDDAKTELTAAATLIDGALKKTPEDGQAWMLRFNVIRTRGAISPDTSPAQRTQTNKDVAEALDKAYQFADPKKPDTFLNIRTVALRIKELINVKDAEAGYRKLLTELPNDRQPRIMLSDFLDRQPARRDEAAAVLESPWKPVSPLHAIDSQRQSINAMIERVRLCTIKLGAIDVVTDPAERDKRLKDVEKLYGDLKADATINTSLKPAMLRIQGGIELQHGKIAEAIGTLDAALKVLNPDTPSSLEQDIRNDVLLQYAQAQLRLGQTGSARPKLAELVERRPENLNARATLADLLIREHNYTDAQQQVAFLQKVIPGNPVIEAMAVRLYAQRTDVLKDRYKDMPETTRDQRLIKLQAAGQLGDVDELSRVARLMLQADPGDVDAVNLLAQVLSGTGHRDEAVAVVAAAVKAKPDDKRLQALQSNLAAVTPDERMKLAQQRVDQISDKFEHALAQAQLSQSLGKLDDAEAALKDAAAQKPDDGRAFDGLFRLYLARQQWDKATPLLDKLAAMNVDQTDGQIRRIQLAAAKAVTEQVATKREAALTAAVNDAANLVQQYKEIANAALLYAQLLQQTGNYSDAADQYAAALDKSPTNADALIGSVQSLFQLGRITQARARLDQAARVAPNDPRVNQLELTYQMQYGDPLKAIDALQAQVNSDPKNALAWGQLGVALDQIARNKAAAHDDAGAKEFTQKAADLFQKAAAQFPDDLRFYVALAADKRALGDNAGAEQVFAKLVVTDKYKDSPEVVEQLADQYSRSGKTDESARVLRDLVTRVKPAPVSTVLKLSWLYAQSQRLQDALATLDLRKDNADAQRQRVQLLIASNNLSQAHAAMDETLASSPSADTSLLAAYVEIRSGNYAKADGFLNNVFRERPNDPAALFYRAQVKLNTTPPNLDGARDDLIKVRDLAPNNIEARVALSDIYLRKQDRPSAVGELQAAWQANRTNKPVLMKLADAYATSAPPAWSGVEKIINDAKQNPQLAADPEVLLLEANMWVGRNEQSKAIAAAKKALAAAPDNAELRQRYFDTLLRARAYRDLLAESEPVLAQDNGAWWLYRLRGQAQRRLDHSTEAQREFDAAFNLVTAAGNEQAVAVVIRTIAEELGPKSAIEKITPLAAKSDATAYTLRLTLASLEMSDRNFTAAYQQLDKLLGDRAKLRDDQARQLYQMLGSYYLQSSPPDLKGARSAFEELLKQTPNDMMVLNNLADILSKPESGGTPAQALKYSQRAYDLSASFGQNELSLYIMDTHGWVLVQNNRTQDGLTLLREAAQTARFPDVYIHLAEASLMTDNLDGAANAIDDAKRVISDYDRRKQPVDPALRPKLDDLTAQIASKRSAKATAG